MQDVTFKSGHGENLQGYLHESDSARSVVFVHGFPAASDYIVSARIGPQLATLGYKVLCFDLTGVGRSEGSLEDKTLTRDMADIGAAVQFMGGDAYLVGHSFGAMEVLMYSGSGVRKQAIVNPLADFRKTAENLLAMECVTIKDGYATFNNTGNWIDGKRIPLSFFQNLKGYDLLDAATFRRKPTLVIKATDDSSVPRDDAVRIYDKLACEKQFVELPGNHRFTVDADFARVVSAIHHFFSG